MPRGLGLALLDTMLFSTGNVLSSRMQALGLTPWMTNTCAVFFGAAILTVAALLLGLPLAMESTTWYVGALLYLAIPGSVIGFTAYLLLIGRLGPERAGLACVLAGNLLAFFPLRRRA